MIKTRIIGHRGAGVVAPENTIYALGVSHGLGLSHVEFDVRLTKDHVPVISHDNSLIRCAHKDVLISDLLYSELKDINVAAHYSLKSLDEKIPTLQEYIEEAHRLGLNCQIEFKPEDDDRDILVSLVTEIIDDFYKDAIDSEMPLVTSFVPECLADFKKKSKLSCKTGVLVKVEQSSNWRVFAQRSECDFVHLHALYLTEKIADDIRGSGLRINGFHLNHPELAKQAIGRGCEKFTCDVPDVFIGLND